MPLPPVQLLSGVSLHDVGLRRDFDSKFSPQFGLGLGLTCGGLVQLVLAAVLLVQEGGEGGGTLLVLATSSLAFGAWYLRAGRRG